MDHDSQFGVWVPGAADTQLQVRVHSPYSGEILGSATQLDRDGIEQALSNSHAIFRDRRRWLAPEKRIEILAKASRLMAERAETLALEAAREGGKPLADSRIEVARAIDGLKNCAELLRSECGREIPMGLNAASRHRLAMTQGEPIGVVLAYSAFNHPVNLIVHQVGPAIAAGCPVIVKPSEATPLSCFRVIGLLREAGLPEDYCQPLVTANHTVAGILAADPRVGFFSFIGSAEVGWKLRSKLAPGVRCALEHGGAAPTIIAEDADLDDCLPLVARASFYHAGQVCVSTQRVYAPRALAASVAERLAALGQAMPVGDPALESTGIGPLIRAREVERVASWVDEAVSAGASLIGGGKALNERCYPPTVILNPPDDVRVSRLEVFGPVVCVYAYDTIDEAICRANALPYAFQAAVFTRSIDTALQCYRGLDASAVMVNEHTAFRVDWMPFAGLKHSGLGVGGIPYSFREMQSQKLLVLHSSSL